MVRKTVSKTVDLADGRCFASRYIKATKNKLPANVKIKKGYKQRTSPKNKRLKIKRRSLGKEI